MTTSIVNKFKAHPLFQGSDLVKLSHGYHFFQVRLGSQIHRFTSIIQVKVRKSNQFLLLI